MPMRAGALLVVFMAAGCATGYHSSGFGGGFSGLRLSERAWEVNFAGNGYMSPERSHAFALRRAAELTHSHPVTKRSMLRARIRPSGR